MKKLLLLLLIVSAMTLAGCQGQEEVETIPPVEEEAAPQVDETVEPQIEVPETQEETEDADDELLDFEILTTTGSLSANDENILEYEISVPRLLTENETAAQLVNGYYDTAQRKYLANLTGETVMKTEDGDYPYPSQVTYAVEHSFGDDTYVSFLRSSTFVYADEVLFQDYNETFLLENGGLVTWDYLFGEKSQEMKDFVLAEMYNNFENDGEIIPEISEKSQDWKSYVEEHMDWDRFYLTENGFVVYTQPGQIGAERGTSFEFPWEF